MTSNRARNSNQRRTAATAAAVASVSVLTGLLAGGFVAVGAGSASLAWPSAGQTRTILPTALPATACAWHLQEKATADREQARDSQAAANEEAGVESEVAAGDSETGAVAPVEGAAGVRDYIVTISVSAASRGRPAQVLVNGEEVDIPTGAFLVRLLRRTGAMEPAFAWGADRPGAARFGDQPGEAGRYGQRWKAGDGERPIGLEPGQDGTGSGDAAEQAPPPPPPPPAGAEVDDAVNPGRGGGEGRGGGGGPAAGGGRHRGPDGPAGGRGNGRGGPVEDRAGPGAASDERGLLHGGKDDPEGDGAGRGVGNDKARRFGSGLPGASPGGGDWFPRVPDLTPETLDQMLTVIGDFEPERAEPLVRLQQTNPTQFMREMRQAQFQWWPVVEMRQSDRERYDLMLEDHQLTRQTLDLQIRYRQALEAAEPLSSEVEALKEAMRSLVDRHFMVRQGLKERELRDLASELDDLRDRLARRLEMREQIVEQRVVWLLGPSGEF